MKSLLALLLVSLGAHCAPPLEWDAADHGGNLVASGAALKRNPPYGPPWEMARSRTSQSTGIRTIEIAIDALDSGQVMIGLANGRASVEAALGTDADSLGYWSIGNTRLNGGWGGVMPAAFGAGDIVGVQVDLSSKAVRFRKNGGEWSLPLGTATLGPDVYVAASLYAGSAGTASLRIISDDWIDTVVPTLNIIVVGDSLSLAGGVMKTYPVRLAEEFQAQLTGCAAINRLAMNGASWDYAWGPSGYPLTLLEDFPRRVVPAISGTLPNWLIVFAGTNGLAIAHHDAAYEFAKFQAYVGMAVAAGFAPDHIIVLTMLPRAGISEDQRSAYNGAIVADAGRVGYRVARLDLDPRIGVASALGDPALFQDGVHPTDAGHEIIKNIIYALWPAEPRRHHWNERLLQCRRDATH